MAHRLSRTARGRAIRNVRVGKGKLSARLPSVACPSGFHWVFRKTKGWNCEPTTGVPGPGKPYKFKKPTLPKATRG